MFKKTPVIAALMGIALTATPALAQEATRIEVQYKDLDLTSVNGQRTLERRLDRAAREACGYDTVKTGSRLVDPSARTCYKQALGRAGEVMAVAVANANGDARLGG